VSSQHATLHSSEGKIDVTFSPVPANVTAITDIGSVTLRVPGNVPYHVDTNAGLGSTHVDVTSSPASPHAITASTLRGSGHHRTSALTFTEWSPRLPAWCIAG
jgi:hypothetical protein